MLYSTDIDIKFSPADNGTIIFTKCELNFTNSTDPNNKLIKNYKIRKWTDMAKVSNTKPLTLNPLIECCNISDSSSMKFELSSIFYFESLFRLPLRTAQYPTLKNLWHQG